MVNPTKIVGALKKAAGAGKVADKTTDAARLRLQELMDNFPKVDPETAARVVAELEEIERRKREAYKVPQVSKEKGKKALAEARRILMTPEQRAAYEAELREAGKQKFLEPSKIKQRLYHGTTGDIYEFDPAAAAKQTGNPTSHFGTFLSESPKEAGRYARDWQHGGTLGGNIMPVHVQMTNPYPMSYKEYDQYANGEFNRFLKNPSEEMKEKNRQDAIQDVLTRKQQLIDQGYDGIVVKVGGINEYIPFSPNQIKSSIGNRGTYDITDPDITKKGGGLAMRETQEGLAPHGMRHSGEGVKGSGYFGYLPASDGYATEMSAEDEGGEFPLLVPTLSREEIEHLLAGYSPTEDIYRKAVEHAERRRKEGKSPFAEATGLKYPVEKADGGAVSFELPDNVTPQNWRKHLASNVLADAKALLGVKDGGAIDVNELLEQAMERHRPQKVEDVLEWAIAKHNHKMKKGGAVSQTFPLKRDEEDELKPTPKYPLVEKLGKGVGAVHEFVSKPFGFENPPGEIASELLGIPGVAKTLERVAYGDPLTSGAGVTTNLLPETTETLFAGLGATPAVVKTGKALAPTAKEMTQFALEKSMEPYQMNIIKPEGGNWIKGAAEKYLKDLRYDESLIDPVGVMNPTAKAEETARVAAMNNFVDKKLSRYLVNQMGTPSDPLRLQADTWAETQKKLLADKDKQISKVQSDIRKAQQARGVDPEVLTRSQARLRELRKERELIQNRKGLHYEPPGVLPPISRRQEAGFPSTFAKTEMGGKWEDMADVSIKSAPYMDQPQIGIEKTYAELKNAAATGGVDEKTYLDMVNEQLEKMGGKYALENPEAPAYFMSGAATRRHLGFDHMMDEIDNALRPSQGLPEYLQLKPKDLDKMSVAQVAEHVDKINAWRASQKAEVDAARAANAATVEHKAYDFLPGTDIPNDQGLRWVEIKAPDASTIELPEGVKRRQMSTTQGGLDVPGVGYVNANYSAELGDLNWAEAEEKAKKLLAQGPVEDALKYEGEILQHCVGGYCPDVIEGRSRIFSLRDAEGRPHATIEVEPDDYRQVWRTLTPEQQNEVNSILNRWTENIDYLPSREELEAKGEQVLRQLGHAPPEKISQIKGLQNRKPNDEYMPFIQDFVKSGQWSDVKDLHHTDLRRVAPDSALATKMKAAGVEPPMYVSDNELSQLLKQYEAGLYSWKRGGCVTKADLEQQYRMAFGGGVFNTDPDLTDAGQIIPEHTL